MPLILSSKIQEQNLKGSYLGQHFLHNSFLSFRGTKRIPTQNSLQPAGKPQPGFKTPDMDNSLPTLKGNDIGRRSPM